MPNLTTRNIFDPLRIAIAPEFRVCGSRCMKTVHSVHDSLGEDTIHPCVSANFKIFGRVQVNSVPSILVSNLCTFMVGLVNCMAVRTFSSKNMSMFMDTCAFDQGDGWCVSPFCTQEQRLWIAVHCFAFHSIRAKNVNRFNCIT